MERQVLKKTIKTEQSNRLIPIYICIVGVQMVSDVGLVQKLHICGPSDVEVKNI